MDQREQHIAEINKQSHYKKVNITDKNMLGNNSFDGGLNGLQKRQGIYNKKQLAIGTPHGSVRSNHFNLQNSQVSKHTLAAID